MTHLRYIQRQVERILDEAESQEVEVIVQMQTDGDPRPMRLGLAATRGIRETRTVNAFKQHCRDSITPAGVPGMPQPQG